MSDVQRCHEVLLQQRTQIRHHHVIHTWIKRCWHAVPHTDAENMTQDEYDDMYSILLYETTICWEEELNDSILHKLWTRDAASYATLNVERFSCSLFFFVEMWVEEITLAEYEKFFIHVHRILSGRDHDGAIRSTSPSFKPTLESFNNALANERTMEELQMNFGKSISFNAQQYYRHFGTPTTHLQAFHTTLLHRQSSAHTQIEPTERLESAHIVSSTTVSTFRMARRQPMKSPPVGTASGLRPLSPLRSKSSSPPRRLLPVTSPSRKVFPAECNIGTIVQSSTPSPERGRHNNGETFVLTGTSVLHFLPRKER